VTFTTQGAQRDTLYGQNLTSSPGPTIVKMAPFLGADAEVPGVGVNTPTLRVRLTDETALYDLEYRYVRDRRTVVDWRPFPGTGRERSLPLTSDTLPGVEASSPTTDHRIELAARDASRRSTSLTTRFRVRIVAPPLTWQHDTSGWRSGNRSSVGGYGFVDDADPRLAPVTQLFNVNNAAFHLGQVRVSRHVVHNPWPVPIRLRVHGDIDFEHRDRLAYRRSGEERSASFCDVGLWYRVHGSHRRGNVVGACDDDPLFLATLVPARVLHERDLPLRAHAIRLDNGSGLESADGYIAVPPGVSAYVYSGFDVFRHAFYGDFEREATVGDGVSVSLHEATAEFRHVRYGAILRDSSLTWGAAIHAEVAAEGVERAAERPLTQTDTETVRIENPPLRLPGGLERVD
jgi:hypothetical protein